MSLHFPRYSSSPFPPYRFIPGENPHPTQDPLGHSFGQKREEGIRIFPERWKVNETYLLGVDLYNYGYWWEAHEAFEGLWKSAPGNSLSKDFFQGLIKISGAFLKWHQQKKTGLQFLYVGGIEHLLHVCQSQEIYMGLNLMEHIAKLSEHFRIVVADECAWPDPLKNYPYIELK